jgi:hypothetical protein
VAGERWQEIRFATGSGEVASMPVFLTKKRGFPMLGMPPFTRVLGPCFAGINGKPEAQRRMRLFLVDELIKQLPPHVIFTQIFHHDEQMGLSWRLNGYTTNVEFTYVVTNCSDLTAARAGMRDTTRRVLKRAEERLVVGLNCTTPAEFVEFYFDNLRARGRQPNFPRPVYQRVSEVALLNGAAQIISVRRQDGTMLASAFTVFDKTTTYYLLTTHSRTEQDNGSVALLIWTAIKQAGERGQAFDFDGFGDRGTAVFLSQFGGELQMRVRVTKMPKILQGVLHVGPRFSHAPE